MTKQKELIYLFSVMFLQVNLFLPFGGARYAIFTGDNVILIIGMIMIWTSDVVRKVKLSNTTIYAFYSGIVFLLVIPFYLYMKNFIVFDVPPQGIGTLIKVTLRLFFIYYFLKYLNLGEVQYKKGLHTILIFGVIATLSILFEDVFVSLGFKVTKFGEVFDIEAISEANRYAGITGLNVNDLGALLSVFIGILLFMYKNKLVNTFQFIFYVSFLAIGVMLTVSRTAFITVNILILLFLMDYLKRISIKTIILILILIVGVFYIYETFGVATLTRLERHADTEYFGLGTRMGYWVLYVQDIVQNPDYLLMGNYAPPTYRRSAHNYYVEIVFKTGIILATVAFYYLFKSIGSKRFAKKNPNILSLDYKYVLVPQILIWATSSSYINWFTLIAFAACGIFFMRDNNNTGVIEKRSLL